MSPEEIHQFWFDKIEIKKSYSQKMAKKWFGKNEVLDQKIKTDYKDLIDIALSGDLDHWAKSPQGITSLIIILDQFPRNAFRATERMYRYDHKAVAWSKYALSQKSDKELSLFERLFIYLPLEHSEDLKDQKICMDLFKQMVIDLSSSELKGTAEGYLDFAQKHYDIVERFGRFPHRNDILNRKSTPEEVDFLKQPGSGF